MGAWENIANRTFTVWANLSVLGKFGQIYRQRIRSIRFR